MKAFLRAKWPELLLSIPAGLAAPIVYQAVAILFMPSGEYAAAEFERAVFRSSSDMGLVAFGAVVAVTLLRWRARNPPR